MPVESQKPSAKILSKIREAISYCPDTGSAYWKHRPEYHFKTLTAYKSWNSRLRGKKAGAIRDGGYIGICIEDRPYQLHKIAWYFQTGYWPCTPEYIDHINGDRSDNRFCNLRVVSQQENCRNMKIYSTNSSGVSGVNWCNTNKKWRARIGVNGTKVHLGFFVNLEDAKKAREKAEKKFSFHENHGKR